MLTLLKRFNKNFVYVAEDTFCCNTMFFNGHNISYLNDTQDISVFFGLFLKTAPHPLFTYTFYITLIWINQCLKF